MSTRILIGLGLVALGVVFLLDAVGAVRAGAVITGWWPLIVVAIGVVQLLDRPQSYASPAVFIVVGLVLLGFTTGALPGGAGAVIWPLALIGAGLWIALRRGGAAGAARTEDRLDILAFFGGRDVSSQARPFLGAAVTALFGGAQLDLREAELPDDGAVVDATAVFGGIDIIVRPGQPVYVTGPAIFGAVEDKSARGGAPDSAQPTLHVKSLALFGGIEIKATSPEAASR